MSGSLTLSHHRQVIKTPAPTELVCCGSRRTAGSYVGLKVCVTACIKLVSLGWFNIQHATLNW